MSLDRRLRMVNVVQRDGVRWQEFGYYFTNIPGLAVNTVDRAQQEWWTLTHLETGHSVGVVVETKELATKIGEALADLDWRPATYPREVVKTMHARVKAAALAEGLIERYLACGSVEFLDPALASLEAEQKKQREQTEART